MCFDAVCNKHHAHDCNDFKPFWKINVENDERENMAQEKGIIKF